MARDGMVWLNQQSIAGLFGTSIPNISIHISNIFKDKELDKDSVVKDYLTTAADGKHYHVMFYSLPMILTIGFSCNRSSSMELTIALNNLYINSGSSIFGT